MTVTDSCPSIGDAQRKDRKERKQQAKLAQSEVPFQSSQPFKPEIIKDDDFAAPVSPINADNDSGWFEGRPVTTLYDDTDISTLLPPDTVMQQRYPEHPAFRSQAMKRESRYSAVNMDLTSLTGPDLSHHKRQPSTTKSAHRNASPRANATPDMTKSMVAHDMGNPYNAVAAPPVPALPFAAPPQIPRKVPFNAGKEPKRGNSASAMRALQTQKVSPLDQMSQLTTENLARQNGLPTTGEGRQGDMISDETRNTKFYGFYDGLLDSPAPVVRESPARKPVLGKARGRK